MQLIMATALITLASTQALALAQTPQTLNFDDQNWIVDAEMAETSEFLGRNALHWRDGQLWLDGAQFDTGEIRFELAMSGEPGHTGIIFRSQGDGDWEKFYFRHHLSNMPDAVQYTPVYDNVTAWQIYSDADAISQVEHGLNRWMQIRLVVAEDSADIFLDGQLIHHIPDLVRERRSGGIGLWQLAPNGVASSYVRNMEVVPQSDPDIIGASERGDTDIEGELINVWRVSNPFSETDLETQTYESLHASRENWTELAVEYNAIANLARAARHSQGDTVFAETTLSANRATQALVRFGYSDRVQVFLNGDRLFVGDNSWRTRDYRYLGTITRHVAVPLNLRAGENTLSFAVSETFGGWGVTAALEEAEGVRMTP